MPPDIKIDNQDTLRATAKQLVDVAKSTYALAKDEMLTDTITDAMPGSSVPPECLNVERTMKQVLMYAGTWPEDIAAKLLDALALITTTDERAAAGIDKTFVELPDEGGSPGGTQPPPGGGDPNAPGGDHPAPEPQPTDPNGPPMDVPGKGGTQKAIDPSQVEYDPKAAGPGGEQNMSQYIDQALDKMGITDPQQRANWKRGYMKLTLRESSWNTNLVPDRDAPDVNNTGAENPVDHQLGNITRGCAQVAPSIFAQYHQPGTSNNIYDPVAQVCASMNYVMTHPNNPLDKPVSRDGHDFQKNIGQASDNDADAHWY